MSAASISRGQLGRQLALRFDRAQDRLLALLQQPQPRDARLDLADLLFVEPAGLVLAIARDEGHRVARIEQSNNALDLWQFEGPAPRQLDPGQSMSQ